MNKPELLTIDKLSSLNLNNSALWVSPRFLSLVKDKFSLPVFVYPNEPQKELNTLIVIGGGSIIDFAKIWRNNNNPEIKLVAIPSIWGSGAENSPIAILNEGGKKVIKRGEEFLPDVRVVWPKLAEYLPPNLVEYACGDVWSHACEGFLSPLAGDELKAELAELIERLLIMPIKNIPGWFELSAEACKGQSRSSVGLIHGIAHNVEGPLNQRYSNKHFGHAQICSICLWPVLEFNLQTSNTAQNLFCKYNINIREVINISKQLYDDEVFSNLLYILEELWFSIIRDPLSRTNCTLVRPNHLSFFTERKFK